jgi:Holliday junction resolvase RusA-like endonuclease
LVNFTVFGNPIALKRHRHHKYGTYDPSKKDKKNFFYKCLEYRPNKPFDKNIFIDINFYFKRPKSHYRTGKFKHLLKMDKYYNNVYHKQKPDLDNLIKFVCDALQGDNAFFSDDCYIVDIKAKKFWVADCVWEEEIDKINNKPRTEIKISEI